MKVICRIMSIVVLFFILLPLDSSARLRIEDINQPAHATAGTLLLTQADILAIHFSTAGIIYTPELVATKVNLTGIVVDDELLSDYQLLRNLVTRQAASFIKAIKKRVDAHVPVLAERFDPMEDVVITIEAEKKTIGTWSAGVWNWNEVPKNLGGKASTNSSSLSTNEHAPGGFIGCSCPSLRKKRGKQNIK